MTYYDLTIDKYLQIKEVLENAGDDDLETQVALLSIINECTEDELLDLPLDEYKKKAAELLFLSEPINPKPNCPKSVTMEGKVYDAVRNVKNFTAGQYIDYQSLLKADDFYSVIPNLLAVFFIPRGKDYGRDYDIMEVAEKIKYNLSIGTALDVCFFFQKQSMHSIRDMLDYLVLMTRIQQMKIKDKTVKEKLKLARKKIVELRDSLKNGVGGTMWM